MKNKIWISYAWADNQDKDIDFIVSALENFGLDTVFDRRVLVPGLRLWEQIGSKISNKDEVDAFSVIVTPNSLASHACMEELSYAMQRALDSREVGFPLIGLLHNVSAVHLPPALRSRLCISLSDPSWVRAVAAGVYGQAPGLSNFDDSPFRVSVHSNLQTGTMLQITPRLSHFSPLQVAVDFSEYERKNALEAFVAPSSVIPGANGILSISRSNYYTTRKQFPDGTDLFIWNMGNEATPTQSIWVQCREPPPRVFVGNAAIPLIELRIEKLFRTT